MAQLVDIIPYVAVMALSWFSVIFRPRRWKINDFRVIGNRRLILWLINYDSKTDIDMAKPLIEPNFYLV